MYNSYYWYYYRADHIRAGRSILYSLVMRRLDVSGCSSSVITQITHTAVVRICIKKKKIIKQHWCHKTVGKLPLWIDVFFLFTLNTFSYPNLEKVNVNWEMPKFLKNEITLPTVKFETVSPSIHPEKYNVHGKHLTLTVRYTTIIVIALYDKYIDRHYFNTRTRTRAQTQIKSVQQIPRIVGNSILRPQAGKNMISNESDTLNAPTLGALLPKTYIVRTRFLCTFLRFACRNQNDFTWRQ